LPFNIKGANAKIMRKSERKIEAFIKRLIMGSGSLQGKFFK
jgi:hypothetical protein